MVGFQVATSLSMNLIKVQGSMFPQSFIEALRRTTLRSQREPASPTLLGHQNRIDGQMLNKEASISKQM